jgi:2-hydroxychromene-2-carboxylate isomerase
MPENESLAGAGSRQETPAIARAIQRRVFLALPSIRAGLQRAREMRRRLTGARHQIDFFHQVDDPYSHLGLEAIVELRLLYNVDFRFHLVSQTGELYAPEPELLADYARRDCGAVAPYYGLEFPVQANAPSRERIRLVESMLAGLRDDSRFIDVALEAGRALWTEDAVALEKLASIVPTQSDPDTQAALAAGNKLREQRRHYSGGMFWYAGEWYWGVDRLHHLERRLISLGAAKGQRATPRFDRPSLDPGPIQNDGRLSLEIFPSLRSPYTAFIFERSIALAAEAAIPVTVLPVMPMVMRGVPAPLAKGLYIMIDAIREARFLGIPFGNMYDPIGRAVERGFSLWPFARDQGRGAEYIAAFLRAAFVEGQPTLSDADLQRVAEDAGLDWQAALPQLDDPSWREELEANRRVMYDELGLWGVPAYRLRGPEGEPDLQVWGQDRLWLVAAEIRRRLGPPDGA